MTAYQFHCMKCNVISSLDEIKIQEDLELKENIRNYKRKMDEYKKIVDEHNKTIKFFQFWKTRWVLHYTEFHNFYIAQNDPLPFRIDKYPVISAPFSNSIKYIECPLCKYRNYIDNTPERKTTSKDII